MQKDLVNKVGADLFSIPALSSRIVRSKFTKVTLANIEVSLTPLHFEILMLLAEEGKSERALFIIDREGIVRYVDIHDIDDQPDNEELFKILRQLEPDAVIPDGPIQSEPEPAPRGAPTS